MPLILNPKKMKRKKGFRGIFSLFLPIPRLNAERAKKTKRPTKPNDNHILYMPKTLFSIGGAEMPFFSGIFASLPNQSFRFSTPLSPFFCNSP